MRQLFYVFREALTNIEKHSRAHKASIQTRWEDRSLRLQVSDDGVGFDPSRMPYGGHYGLKFMKERVELLNGSLKIKSTDGAGTTLEVQVPYE
jgi:signal transduction histidine kinase